MGALRQSTGDPYLFIGTHFAVLCKKDGTPVREGQAGALIFVTRADVIPGEDPLKTHQNYNSEHSDELVLVGVLDEAGIQYERNPFKVLYNKVRQT